MRSGPGVTFGLGALLAIAGTGFHAAVIAPAARELGAIMAPAHAPGAPPSGSDLATVQRLQARMASGARTWAVLLLLGAVGHVRRALRRLAPAGSTASFPLTGLVESYARKCAIDRAVGCIVGVKDLRDYLHVRPSDGSAQDDGQIEQAANRALGWDVRVPKGIRTKVTGGVLRLRGAVQRFRQREAAEDAVRNLKGLRDIVNEIALFPTAPPADAMEVKAVLRRRLGPASRAISVAAVQGVVTLRGLVPAFAVLGQIERAVWSIRGITRIDNQLQVA